MPRTCTLCNHPERESIERALLANESFRHIATRYGTSTGALQRHKSDHLTRSLTLAREAETIARADSLLSDVRHAATRAERLYCNAEKILEMALKGGDAKNAINAIKVAVSVMAEARQYLELRGDLTGELEQPTPAYTGPLTILALPKCEGVPTRAPSRTPGLTLAIAGPSAD